MTKEHLELVYSRKKLPYERKGGSSNETMTLITLPDNITQQVGFDTCTKRDLGKKEVDVKYSECLNTERPKSKLRRNLNGRGFGIQTVWILAIRAFGTTVNV